MLKSVLMGSSIALAAFALPATAQTTTPSQKMPSQQQMQKGAGTTSTLNLTAEERHTVLQNVDKSSASGSTMGLGALTEGSTVPSGAKPQKFSDTVTTKVPKLKNYSYVAADNKVAIVDPAGSKIVEVLDQNASGMGTQNKSGTGTGTGTGTMSK